MKIRLKHTLPFLLALVMVLCLVPNLITEAAAAAVGTTGVDYTDQNLNKKARFNTTLSGNTITATAKGLNLGPVGKSTGKGSVTLTNTTGSAATLVFTCTVTNGSGSVEVPGEATIGSGTKTYSKALPAGEGVTITITGPDGGKITVDITVVSLTAAQSGIQTTFKAPTNGSYKVDGQAITGETRLNKASTESYAVAATAASGYKFFGWYSEKTNGYISYTASTNLTITEATAVYPVFITTDTPVFGVGGAAITDVSYSLSNPLYLYEYSYYKISPSSRFTDLQDALDYAKSSGNSYVVLMNSATLPARADGSAYTVPSGVTLLIPFDSSNKGYHAEPYLGEVPEGVNGVNHLPTVYRTLTMAAGAKIEVSGKLEVAADHYISHGGITLGGQPISTYAQIVMGEDSSITVKYGGNLYAWGYITGADSATVTAKSGATVYEKMQVSDYGGGSVTDKVLIPNNIFPFNQYYIQNVEVHETFEYGSTLICHAGIYGNGVVGYTMSFIGDGAMFQLGERSTVTKYYNNSTDRLSIDASGTLSLNAISIAGQDTADFVLPFNHNITITLKDGTTATANQDILIQPGSVLNVEEGATLNIAEGRRLFVMDADNWGNYCYGRFLQQVPFVPRTGTFPNVRQSIENVEPYNKEDGKIVVDGTVVVKGSLFTSDAHASITSSKTGVIQLVAAAPASTTIPESTAVNVNVAYENVNIPMNPAMLTNGSKTVPTTDTAGAAAGTTFTYCATCDKWVKAIEVTFDANAGENTAEGTMAVQKMDKPCCTKLTKNAFTIEDMKFLGWNTIAEPTDETLGTAYADEAVLSTTDSAANITLYAQWGLIGDVDLDGEVRAADATMLARHLAKIEVIKNEDSLEIADIDGNGTVAAADATKLARYLAKIITDWDQE